LAGIPVTERRLELAGVSTALLVAGEGPPIVMLHGGIEAGGVSWAPVIPHLAERHRLILPDLPGLGESAPVAALDARVFAEWFTALLRVTCDEKPTLIGRSLDGSMTARFASQHGHLLRGLVLCGSPAIGRYRVPLGLLLAATCFDFDPSGRSDSRFEDWAFLDPARTHLRDPGWYDAFVSYGRSRAAITHVKRTMWQLIEAGSKQTPDGDLRSIDIPVALIWGRRDRMVPLGVAERASANFGWPLHVVDEAGHVPHIEQPEAFVRAVRAALHESAESLSGDQRSMVE